MANVLEAIGNLLARKNLTDEETINRAAVRSARGDEPKSEREIAAVADALHRLGKDQNFLAGKIEAVKQHDAAVAAEAAHHLRAAEVKKLREQYAEVEAQLAPIQKRMGELEAILLPKEQQTNYDQATIVGTAARLKAANPALLSDAK